jgi:hypothetical protein
MNVQYFLCVQVPKYYNSLTSEGVISAPSAQQQPHRVQMGRALIMRL